MVEHPLALEKRLGLMEKITGVFSEFISLKRLSNLFCASLKTLGKFKNK
jgi:hypothetical protein